MGNTFTDIKRPDPEYDSIPWEDAIKKIRPFDVLLFKGGDFVSDGIRKIEKLTTKIGAFSHAALVISPRYLGLSDLDPDKLYTWEITMSGKLNDGVTDYKGRSFLGVQIRPLDEVVAAVLRNGPRTRVAWLPLKINIEEMLPIELQRKATALFTETYEAPYEACLCVLLAASCPRLRCCSTQGTSRFFCSEFVAYILKGMGFLPVSCKEQNVIPVDFIPNTDTDKEINCCEVPKYLV